MSFEHLGDVLGETDELGRLFTRAGYRIFLVGGVVRDQWLDHQLDTSSDIDLTTNALPGEIKRIVAPIADDLWTQGERFGTIGLRAGGRDYEITTHRAESYSSDSRKPIVSFGDNVEVDLSRRDFTVNAMAIELPAGELVDPFGGADDLRLGLLRTPLSADVSFTDDPLRMLRAARFATKYRVTPDDELVESATRLHSRLRIVAIERIGVELKRLLGLDDVAVGLRFLADTGLLVEVLGCDDDSLAPHIKPRIEVATAAAAGLRSSWLLRLAALGVAVFGDGEGVRSMCRRLRLSRDDERSVVDLATGAVAAIGALDTEPKTLRRWMAGCDDHDGCLELAAAVAPEPDRVQVFADALRELCAAEDSEQLRFLDGATIMAVLDATPGPIIGEAQAHLHDAYIEHGPLSEAEQIALLRAWRPDTQRR